MDTQPHVLILDPDPSIRVLLVAVVRRCGLEATACGTGEAAVEECLHRARYAAAIVSADMPRFGALLHQLRLPARHLPAIIVTTTTHATPHAGQADAVLSKPFALGELQATIAACCGIAVEPWTGVEAPTELQV